MTTMNKYRVHVQKRILLLGLTGKFT